MYQNHISLIGFVGNDVQLKSTKNGTPVAVLSVATKSSWKNSNGEYDSRTEWHRVTAWSKLAEFAGKLEKGAHVQIEGELRYREYHKNRGSDADAAPIKQRVAEIHVKDLETGSRGQAGRACSRERLRRTAGRRTGGLISHKLASA